MEGQRHDNQKGETLMVLAVAKQTFMIGMQQQVKAQKLIVLLSLKA